MDLFVQAVGDLIDINEIEEVVNFEQTSYNSETDYQTLCEANTYAADLDDM